jgi:tetratricopeptide (TPR) repeat protein
MQMLRLFKPLLLPGIALAVCAVVLVLPGQQASAQQAMQEARKLFNQSSWPEAEQAFKAITESQPKNGTAWLFLGATQHNQNKFKDAIRSFEKADATGVGQARARFNIARSYARLGNIDDSFAWLEKATGAGFNQMQALQSNSDLKDLRGDQRFAQIVEKTDRNARPCEYDPNCRAFDFWIGEWEVFTPNGQKAGENIIEKTINGCMLLENWTSVSGGAGKSMNFYDASVKKWKQLWVNGTGGVTSYEGDAIDGALHFEGYQIQSNGKKALFKMVFTPQDNGDVRQYITQSLDDGKTWQVWFDGMYKRKTPATGMK